MKNSQEYRQAVVQCENIAAMVAALECDYNRLNELRELKECHDRMGEGFDKLWPVTYTEEAEELAELEQQAGDCEDEDDARERILEDALSVEVRSGWSSVIEELTPEEFCITLCYGGPAVRIIGELGLYGEPVSARVEYQGWGTPWTELVDKPVSREDLLTYCRQFHYTY